jgi:DNA-binding transcriptional MerR regulator
MVLLAPQTVARRLDLSTSRIAQLDREGRLPAIRDSAGRRLYDPEVVERFAREREASQFSALQPAGTTR